MRLLPALFSVLALLAPAPAARAQDQKPPPAAAHAITDEAQRIWEKWGEAIYQVQTIDLNSGKKSSIGSGFQFSADGLIATNYHVVAAAIQRPESNRLEYLHDTLGRGDLKVLTADVVHDLAILKMEQPGKVFVEPGQSALPKGARLFSLGNPHDIGFTIIEGTYNGVNRESFIDKIHFSGSLNPGMSGGPALGHNGRVVGVNVSTAGNQISFLVPVEPLKDLLAAYRAEKEGFDFIKEASAHIEAQLLKMQQKNVDRLLAQKWESVAFGDFMMPGRVNTAFKCWGDTRDEEKLPVIYYPSGCNSQDRLFLDNEFTTGVMLYRYDRIVGKPKISLPRFYHYYENQYGMPINTRNASSEDDVTNFDCNNGFVDIEGKRWKSSFCVRQYKKYRKLYDMHLYMALVDEGKTGLMVTQIAEGISRENALKLAGKFIGEIHVRAKSGKGGAPADAAPKTVSAKEPAGEPAAEPGKRGEEKP